MTSAWYVPKEYRGSGDGRLFRIALRKASTALFGYETKENRHGMPTLGDLWERWMEGEGADLQQVELLREELREHRPVPPVMWDKLNPGNAEGLHALMAAWLENIDRVPVWELWPENEELLTDPDG